jgi:hypothetical protein
MKREDTKLQNSLLNSKYIKPLQGLISESYPNPRLAPGVIHIELFQSYLKHKSTSGKKMCIKGSLDKREGVGEWVFYTREGDGGNSMENTT